MRELVVSATNSLGWEVQTRRIDSNGAWGPAVLEVVGYTEDDDSIEVPMDLFKTHKEAKDYLDEMLSMFKMNPDYEFRVYEVVEEKKK